MTSRPIRQATAAAILDFEGSICPVCRWRRVDLSSQLHEIVSRGRVQGASAALLEVFASPELCALVCPGCHPKGNNDVN